MSLDEIPIIQNKDYAAASIFTPENLIKEAQRQKQIAKITVPSICILDPDGDLTNYILQHNNAEINNSWVCYHTKLYNFEYNGNPFGIIPFVVGASFAVLVAEELFASGCKLLLLLTSSGNLSEVHNKQRFIIIEKAIRDEGVSYHYLPPSIFSTINKSILQTLKNNNELRSKITYGVSWTTDAPFRETQKSIDNAIKSGAALVEMESAALYAFGESRNKPIICLAYITNEMGQQSGDFEKGINNGGREALEIIDIIGNIFKEET